MANTIKVDTDAVISSKERLKKVKNRIAGIDKELNKLNKDFDLLSLLGFEYNKLQKYNYILDANINYLACLAADIDDATNNLNKIDPLSYKPPKTIFDYIQEAVREIPGFKIPVMYMIIIEQYIENKLALISKLPEGKDLLEAFVSGVGFLSDEIIEDIDDVKDILEYISNSNMDFGLFDDFTDSVKHLDNFFEVFDSLRRGEFVDAGTNIFDEMGLVLKAIDKQDVVLTGAVHGILIDAIVNIPSRFISNIQKIADDELTTSGEVYWDTVVEGIGLAVVDFAEPVYNLTTIAAYPVVDDMLENIFGYDLSGEYEKLSDKKGIEAVFDVQKKFWVDTVYEEGIRDQGVKLLNGFYEGSEKLVGTCWNKITSIF